MPNQLKVSVGQHSDKGRKEINQDFHGVYIPQEPLLSLKGVVIALADGISSSDVSQIASEVAVTGFLADYFCTSEAWSVKKSAQRVLMATNTWLHSQSQQSQHRYNKDRGYVCTFSAMVIKSNTAHIFHAGDARIYRLQNHSLEQLTEDHRLWISQEKSYLSRALGIKPSLEIDYLSLQAEQGDIFILVTDGTYEYTNAAFIVDAIYANKNDLDDAAKSIVNEAYKQGSGDNLSIQIVRVDELPNHDTNEIIQHITELPFPPMLEARMEFDGYKIIREVHASSRSHVYLAVDSEENTQVILKTPSVDKRNDQAYMDRFLMEEWIARRIDSPYVLKPCSLTRKRNYLYIVVEFIEGQTLNQWMIDNPNPSLENVRNVVEQIAKGLRAFHRLEMLHQDLQPNNIMIEATGMVKIIDFGSTRVAGLAELTSPIEQNTMLGTAAYTAPEYFLGEGGTTRSDLFSLAVITYQMLSGKLPYGAQVAKCRTKAAQNKLHYNSILDEKREIPVWIDDVLKKALHPKPCKRYEELTEFVYDLRHPNEEFLNKTRPPLMDRNPIIFWKSVSFILSIIVIILLSR
jgi:serine/threonine protein kinase/serine/threonine protein phosphatase PrpC